MKKHSLYLALGVLVTFASCTKKTQSTSSSSNNNNTNNGITVNSTPQFTGSIGGTSYSLVNGTTYTNGTGSSKGGSNPKTATYSSYIVNAANSGININKGTISYPSTSSMPDTATFRLFFAPNTYSYSVNYVNGVEVTWTDANGVIWSTSNGTGSQTGSTFKITAEQYANDLGYQDEKVLINFSCTLYNPGGTSMQLTNGVFVGYFENN